MIAWAAEATAEHSGSFLATTDFWVLVAFILFFALIGRTAFRVVTAGLDSRAEAIRNRVEEARRLKEEAQELLASYERKQVEARQETEQILVRAREEAQQWTVRASQDLERSLNRQEQLATERIAQVEAAALDEVRSLAVDLAMDATRRVLAEQVSGEKAASLIDGAVKELPERLH